ncbi:60S ribosomal protein subunit export [Zygosaccharomyces mellis]|uniref:60S ribosomal protein subunit export n=1 Tax=Zygosaccharomyces mellis TaxID=42258 RepID=A0A4C2E9Q0_9SACH|nr:60S ribosomal protein subunit export [Zygosaccharomyces mellis]
MAKKVSRNSRAARQAEAFEPEAKTLSELPRPEKTDLSNILIRTTAKNEALLEAKINKKSKKKVDKKKSKEKAVKDLTHLDRNRMEKALNFGSRLDGKISKSTSRAKYIQNIRKAGWDTTNELIRKELAALQDDRKSSKSKARNDDDPDEMKDEPNEGEGDEMETEDPAEELKPQESSANRFGVLPVDNEA